MDRVYAHAGLKLPAELRWFSPVLPSAHAPLTGYQNTADDWRFKVSKEPLVNKDTIMA
jgi:hypothetical protein